MRLLVPFLLTACGESWTWDADNKLGDTGGGADSGTALHDLDGDGFTDIAAGGDDCWDDPRTTPAEFTVIAGATQPTAAEVHPNASETWYDGIDQDCAGDDDFDQDRDTHRSATHADGTGATGDDCYDAVDDAYPSGAASCAREGDLAPAEVYPGATDAAYDGTDADCSGNDDFDQDNDGFGRCAECDDTNASIYPNDAPEVWYDGVDANCDGNDGDQDGDGYYVEGYSFTIPADYEAGDCVDTDAGTHPDAADAWYDGTDSNCLGDDDFDQDGDGAVPTAYGGDDCDDTDNTVYLGAPDAWYDGVDSDCAGNDDFDQDGDGYNSTDDCDDLDAGVNPAAAEDCATADDDDCDGDTNDLGALACVVYYEDADGDGYGGMEACLCTATAIYTLSAGDDCDDADAAVSPAEAEVCNDGLDNDCDGGGGSCELTGGSLSGADAIWTGGAADDLTGAGVATAGDVNGDGYDDMLVGAWYDDEGATNAGAAYLILGTAAPTGGSLSSAVKYVGANEGEGTGRSVSGAGDTNGDGYADVLVGAPTNQDVATYAGAVVLILGGPAPSSAPLYDSLVFSGEEVMNYAGFSLSPAGDVNGDSLDDVVIGAYGKSDYAGAAYVILGSSSPVASSLSTAITFEGESFGNFAGWAVAGGEDADGDGFDDMLVGATAALDAVGAATGAAYLVYGSGAVASANLTTAVKYTGEGDGDEAGCAVAASGDLDGDGYGDFLVGAAGNSDGGSNAGAAYVLLGSSAPASTPLGSTIQFTGEAFDDEAGGAVSGAGDVDGDGHDDILVGASQNGTAGARAGAAYLVLGANSLASESLSTASRFTGENATDYAGIDAAGAGDVNADGYSDFLIGAYLNDAAAHDAGAAYLILGTGL